MKSTNTPNASGHAAAADKDGMDGVAVARTEIFKLRHELTLSNRVGDTEVAHASYADAGRRKLRHALAIVRFHGAANRQRIVTTVPSKRPRGLQPSEVEVQTVMLVPPCGGDPPSRVALLLLQPQPSASSPLVPRSTTPSTPNDISSADQIFAAAAQGLRQRSWRPAPDISAGWATCILHWAT